jgi:hypothetical protein
MTKALLTNSLPQAGATNETALRDIKPPVHIPSGWDWLLWVVAGLAAVALLYGAWLWWRRRRAAVPPVTVIPAHVRAWQKLEEALALIGQPREFCILVSDTIRWYLEERFDFRAPERTTEEFLRELQVTSLLTSEQKRSLGEFLEKCDLVKFAKYEPAERELRDLHGSALRLVEETRPIALDPVASTPQMTSKSEPAPG